MKRSWKKFRTDPYYLVRYLGIHTLILITGIILAFMFINHDSLHLNYTHLFYLPLAFCFGVQVPTLMHNCVHDNLKGRYSNFIIGELACFFVLMSLSIIGINHTLHHAHADSHEDPHNPAKKTFMEFFFTSLLTGVEIIGSKYYMFHGKSTKSKILYNSAVTFHHLGIFLRVVLWYQLLGPTMFVAFFVPAFISYVFSFAHVNYITHVIDEKGGPQIINVDSNLYYNFINFIGSGVYYHKNHHLNPKCFNPKYYKISKKARALAPRMSLNQEAS